MTETPPRPVSPGTSVYPILTINFVGALGFGIILPFLVFLVTRLGGNAVIYGFIVATYPAFQLFGAPILGRWSDRFGRRKILLLSQLGTLTAWAIFLVALRLPVTPLASVELEALGAFTLTLPLLVLFFARALDGLTGGNISVANAYLADITSDEERSAAFGRMAVASNLGYIGGPALAGLLGGVTTGEWLPVLAALFISAVAVLIILVALRDPEPCILTADPELPNVGDTLGWDQKECFSVRGGQALSTRDILGLPNVGRLIALQFLVFVAFNFYYVAFPVYAATSLAWPLAQVGVYFAVLSLLMALVEGPVLRRLSRRLGDRRLVVFGSLLLAIAFAFFTSDRALVLYSGTVLMAAGNGLMWPSLLSSLSKVTDRSTQGAVQGLASSVNAVASILGLLAGGMAYRLLGPRVFLLSTAITALVFLLGFGISRGGDGRGEGAASR